MLDMNLEIENNRMDVDELVDFVYDNKKKIIKVLAKEHVWEEYEVLKIKNDSIKLKDLDDDSIETRDIDNDFILKEISEFDHLYKVFDKLGFKDDCLEATNDYDGRILELAQEVAKTSFNIEDYEFKITDGSQDEDDFYYIVCWLSKTHIASRNKELTKMDFKLREEREGGSFLLEMSSFPKFNHLVEREWMDDDSYLYACYLTYLYTRNMEKKSNF